MSFHEFYRTNQTVGGIELTNWNINYSDSIEIILRVNQIIGNWPIILQAPTGTNYYFGLNCYSRRSVINCYRGGAYSGDAAYISTGVRDPQKLIRIYVENGTVQYYSGYQLDDITTLDSSATLGPITGSAGIATLFLPNNNIGDISLYHLKVWNNGELIHWYVAGDTGLVDLADHDTVFPYTATGYLLGPEIPRPRPPVTKFNITLMRNNSESYKVGKKTRTVTTLAGVLRDRTSIIDPVILIEVDPNIMMETNYLYIEKFRRYYFINDTIIVRNRLVEVHCHVDVLESFKDEIKGCSAIISKQENDWNLYINDGSFKTYQNPMVLTKYFESGFDTYEFVLALAGGYRE